MTYENIQIATQNLAIDRSGSAFYTVDHATNSLIKKTSGGATIFSYFLAEDVNEVYSLQFDGVYFWTLEYAGAAGFRIRKWEIGSDDLVRLISQIAKSPDTVNKYDVRAFAVEHYSDTLDGNALVGDLAIDVNDGSVVRAGDRIVIGPSTAVGFEGEYAAVTVTGKTGNTLNISPSLAVSFSPNEALYFTRSIFAFSDTGPAGLVGAVYKYNAHTGALLTVDVDVLYSQVRGSTFFKDHLMFVKGGEVIWVDPDSQTIVKSQAIDNLDASRSTHKTAYDLAGFGDVLYRLEQTHVYFDGVTERWTTENWAPNYNYNTSSTIPAVYFVALKAEPPILHRAVTGLTPQAEITVEVLDQFRTPVQSRTVDFSSTGGALSSAQEVTDANGRASTTYTANTTVGTITITAEVT